MKKSIWDKAKDFYFYKDWQIGKDDRCTIFLEISHQEIYLIPTILIYRSGNSWGPLEYLDIIFMWGMVKISIGDSR